MKEVLDYVRAHAKPHYHSEVIDKLADLPQPVISAVQGHCSPGALELALAADLIVAAETAQFCDAYARWGLTPDLGIEPAAAASRWHALRPGDDAHVPQLFRHRGAGHASGEFLLPG